MKLHHAFVGFAAAAFATTASAQTLKPGLWEVTNKMQGGGEMGAAMAQAQKEMANMPPEQRKMMEQMMAKHGVKMGAGGPGDMSARICMTKDMVDRDEIPAQQGDCKMTSRQRSGKVMKFAFSCANPPSTGDGVYTFVSPEAYNVKMNVRTTIEGKPQTMLMDGAGKWIGADCGSVKPLRPPQSK